MNMLRGGLRMILAVLGGMAGAAGIGCGPAYGVSEPMYGVYPAYGMPIPAHDPALSIADFSYSPESPVLPGATITFSLTTNKPTSSGFASAIVGDFPGTQVDLNDLGLAPDATAGDAIWTGEWVVPDVPAIGPLPVNARLDWWDGYPSLNLDGPPLTIVEEEDNSQ